jgi:ATP dependent DNA ligase domain
MGARMLQRTLPAGFIAPCLPTKTDKLPSGGQWLHEIKHDGFRIIARKSDGRVRLYSRPGNDFTRRFPLIVEALERLRSRSCIIDGEAVACDDNGVPSFDRIRYRRHGGIGCEARGRRGLGQKEMAMMVIPPGTEPRIFSGRRCDEFGIDKDAINTGA